MRRRRLSREDRAVWDEVARRVRPMRDAAPDPVPDTAPPAPVPAPPLKAAPPPLAPFRLGAKAPSPAAAPDPAPASIRMDRKAFLRMKGGKLDPEARIDLHGMTLAEAHPALIGFILRSQAEGRRLVLVITGKGRGTEWEPAFADRRGVLRRQVPHWLQQAPLTGAVLQVTPAHRKHGGEGAFYVYLRRPR
ncbi:Smr/MutS family protein [Rhodovulum visakhapatnamense]|uniref:DNA-nicking Smr family endonuclease n=1 Tax=Rhodovulum visakhapatnamense TaxID=364297 RepID=A0A4R8FY43_9RHOB|nr:Smr/MutS family protein [Rhodovulum visakhapatnamense]TDX31921.1 DNA-nicking Smr family endonuclease [Rhodovulum visakhapatnamense]